MAAITWSDPAAVDGTTVWNAQREQRIRDDITAQVNGNLQTANMAAGGIGTTALANPNAVFVLTVPFALYHDAFEAVVADPVTNAQFVAARTGVTDRLGTTVDLPVGLPFAATFLNIASSCLTSTGTNNARFRRNGADVANTTVAFTTGTLVRPSADPTALAVITTDTLLVRVTLSAGAADGVVGGLVYLYFQMTHRA